MSGLSRASCVPCRGGDPPLTEEETKALLPEVPDWNVDVVDGVPRLERVFKLADFAAAVRFTNRIAELSEAESHHPLIVTEWGRVTVQWWTHKIRGLHRNDFIMAAKTDALDAD